MMRKKILGLAAILVFVFSSITYAAIPAFEGYLAVAQNDNYPDFTVKELTTEAFDTYSDLDQLGRAGTAFACIGRESFPLEERGSLEGLYPSGWNNAWYDHIEDGYVWNRCHLIANQLTGNDTINNLITGTHCLNVEGMLPYENWVAMYISNTGNHVLYRVTPIYEGSDLVASAVQMEAYSVEDMGAGICFNVLIYNVQDGVGINYSDGANWADDSFTVNTQTLAGPRAWDGLQQMMDGQASGDPAANASGDPAANASGAPESQEVTYILNTNSHKFHYPYCDSVYDMKEKNKAEFYGTREEVIDLGYEPCGRCNP